MLKRKILDHLIKWKQQEDKKCLLVEGMRQTGKTFIIDYFANQHYQQYININFLINKKYCEIFNEDLDIQTICKKIKYFKEFNDINFNEQILLFLDEIQACPNAITALKSLSQARNIHVIASGSYLGMKYKEDISFPVGYVDIVKMYPLNFEEFLWANDISQDVIDELTNSFNAKKSVDLIIHKQMLELFKKYILVGGMPAVVDYYINHEKNIFNVQQQQKNIVEMFFYDTLKYAPTTDKQKIIECFNSIPNQLAKENKKFMFSKINPNARSKWYYSAINWLIDSNIVNKCTLVSALNKPLNAYEINDHFKLYLADTGLLISMLDTSIIEQIMYDEEFIFKGAIFENVIGQMLCAKNYKLRYYNRNNTLEIDFIIVKNNDIYALEVKASNNKSKSLSTILKEKNDLHGIKLSNANISAKDYYLNLPWYILFLI